MPAGQYIRSEATRSLMSLSHLGKKVTEATKEKIRQSNIATQSHLRFKNGPAWNKGLKGVSHHSEETKRRISETNKSKGHRPPPMSGEDHYNWQGGITPQNLAIRNSPQYAEWRESVFARDGWTCQKSKKSGNACVLRAHHIESFDKNPDLRLDVNNGIALSDDVHRSFHNTYGRGDNTRQQLEQFLAAA